MIGLVVGGSDRVVSYIDLGCLGIVHQSPSLWRDRSRRRLYVVSLNWVVNHTSIDRLDIVHQPPSLWQDRSC